MRFGVFELDYEAGQLTKEGRVVRLQPKPFKLLCLLVENAGKLVTREEIQQTLWSTETFVDFEQGVNFAMKQVRQALGDEADRPLYVQTVPRRGYRFLAPVDDGPVAPSMSDTFYRPMTDGNLNKLLWTHIAELKTNEQRQRKRQTLVLWVAVLAAAVVAAAAALFFAFR
jgi:DNA-binding winged helix-turn-helix (wHTH) protein